MKNFIEEESICSSVFARLGECYHLWTPEDFEIIFNNEDDFKIGMSIIGICAKLFPDIKILTFELMTNHLHIAAAGEKERLRMLFNVIKKMLTRWAESIDRAIAWDKFEPGIRALDTLNDLRNVIAYINRNGYVVSPDHTPFTYPWGANKYYYNPVAEINANDLAISMSLREIRKLSHSRLADNIKDLRKYDGYALPLSFCDIPDGEAMFRNASHYFNKISKCVESDKEIAKELGERVFYTDDELFSIASKQSQEKYSERVPSRLSSMEKIELAKILSYDYNASTKQLVRILKIQHHTLESLGLK